MTDNDNGAGGSQLDLNICGLCGKAFVGKSGSRDVCDRCKEEEAEIYTKVRDLVRDNPDRSFNVDEAARVLHIPERKIQHLVNKGLIQLGRRSSGSRSHF